MLRNTPMDLLRHFLRHPPGAVGKARLAALLDRHYRAHPGSAITRTRHGTRHRVDTRGTG